MSKNFSVTLTSPKHIKILHFSSSSKRFLSSIPNNVQFEQHPQNYILQLLQSCKKVRSFVSTKSLHALTITMRSFIDQPLFMNNNVMSLYASIGEIGSAHHVFDEMDARNAVSYNTMISGYSKVGGVDEAWDLFNEMRFFGFRPTQFTLGGLLSCGSLDLCRGYQLQGLIVKNGLFYADAFAGTALLGLFKRHSCIGEGVQIFDEMPIKSLVTMNSMISLFAIHGFVEETVLLFRDLIRSRGTVSEGSFVGIISGFESEQDLQLGEHLHALVIKMGLNYKILVSNSLINMYAKCSSFHSAEKVFREAPVRDVVSWNTVIRALEKTERPNKSFQLLLQMPVDNVCPNSTSFVSVINLCASMQSLLYGQFFHTKVVRNGFASDAFVGSALVDFYAKCDKLDEAHCCFDEIYEKNIVSWNALISGIHCSNVSVCVFRQMLQAGYCPNEVTFSAVLQSSLISDLQQLHCLVTKMGYEQNRYVLCSLITSYAKNGILSDALTFVTKSGLPRSVVLFNVVGGIYNKTGQYHKTQELFSLVEEPDIISWNILIASCARNGDNNVVFELLKFMQINRTYPDNYTLVSFLSVCAKLCNLALGSSIHGLIIKTDFTCCDTFICNVLLDMYGKCGSVKNAEDVFNEMADKNLISWTALISAHGINGYAHEALKRFEEMQLEGFKPDEVAFIVVLSACKHGGLVKEGMNLFYNMKSIYGIEPRLDHYNCAVDLLARYGHLKQAEQLITSMPFPPNALIWRSFLGGCERQRALKDQLAIL